MTRLLLRNILIAMAVVMPFSGGLLLGSPQENISGIINTYARVNTIEAADALILDDVSGFSNGDTVLVMQMKGVSVINSNTGAFGSEDGFLNGTHPDHGIGFYEFIIIEQVESGPKRITFRNNLLGFGKYNVEGFIQVVRVPSYKSATVTSGLNCAAWDSVTGTGGILALIVNKKLELQADIDVTGKGFAGGPVSTIDGIQAPSPDYYYPESSPEAGWKGEGLATHINGTADKLMVEDYAKGIGALFTGGGGATGEFSGSGGGANFGKGGDGTKQRSLVFVSGKGGWKVEEAVDFPDRILMGGGGGAGGENGGTASGGGNGGGIIFILTDTIIGNGYAIRANGDSLTTIASGDGSAGGGGAGGSVVLSVKSYALSNIIIEAEGGTGGHSYTIYGSGGGGGGGLVWIRGSSAAPECDISVAGGAGGRISYPSGISQEGGESGIIRTDLNMLLNGFLFNSIISSFTGTQVDSICYGQHPQTIMGTEPVGGVQPYTFRWEKKGDEETVWSLVPGSGNTQNLILTDTETDTLEFRRVVTDNNATPVSDTSKTVTIIVQPLITDNFIGYDTIICAGQDPELLIPVNTGPGGGNGNYFYVWIDSTTVHNWQFAPGTGTNADYDPPVLTESAFYKRVIVSGRCIDTSNHAFIEVLPVISNNTIASDQLICTDNLFADLSGSDPAGGDGSYGFEWIGSTDQSIWSGAEGTNDGKNYDPDENSSDFPGDKYYRRVVRSGHLDCCVDTSAQVLLTRLPLIGNNIIQTDHTICEDSVPDPLTGNLPVGGDGANYTYIWEDSTRTGSWNLITGADQKDYYPPALTDTTWYRRIVISSACDDTSNIVVVNVNPAILNNSIQTLSGNTDTTICSGQVPLVIKGETPSGGDGSYLYEWQYSIDQTIWNTAPGINDQADYNPPALTQDTWYRREVLSGECATLSNTVEINVLPLISGNTISAGQTVCFNTRPALISGNAPGGGNGVYTYLWESSTDNVNWAPAAGINDGIDYQPGYLTEETYFRRKVSSGLSDCCEDISDILTIGIYPLPEGTITALQDTSCSGSPVSVEMNLTGAAPWTVTLSDGKTDLAPFNAPAPAHTFIHSPVYTSDYSFVSITDNNGCVAANMTGSRKAVVYEIPVADPGTDDEVCGPEYTLQANPSVGTGSWINYDGVIVSAVDVSSTSKTVNIGSDYGTQTFWWKEQNWECVDSASVDITFWEAPELPFAGEDKQLKPFEFSSILEADEPFVGTGTWSVIQSSGNPVFDDINYAGATVSDLSYGENILEWTVVNGVCPAVSDQVSLSVATILIPDGFSPNGDQYNQTFLIEGLEFTENELIITNISGAVVYRATNYNNDWAGLNLDGNPLPDGTYYYYLTIKSPGSERLSGFVVIKR